MGGGSQAKGLQYFIEGGSGQMITILHRGDGGGGGWRQNHASVAFSYQPSKRSFRGVSPNDYDIT